MCLLIECQHSSCFLQLPKQFSQCLSGESVCFPATAHGSGCPLPLCISWRPWRCLWLGLALFGGAHAIPLPVLLCRVNMHDRNSEKNTCKSLWGLFVLLKAKSLRQVAWEEKSIKAPNMCLLLPVIQVSAPPSFLSGHSFAFLPNNWEKTM